MKLRRSLLVAPILLGKIVAALAILAAAACGPADSGSSGVVHAADASPSAVVPSTETETPSLTPAPKDTASRSATATPEPDPRPTTSATLTATPWPSATPSPTPCAGTQGRFTSVNVPSGLLRYDINTRIYLPPCYASSGKSYPVLYLVHGLNFTEDQWERLGIGAAADRLIASGQIAPLIMVLPRDRDDPRLDPAFVVDLVPYIDGHYRTRASASYRAIGGMSRGGGWSIHLGLRYPNVFGRVGGHSPAVFFGDENNVLQYVRAAVKNGSTPALYLDVGADDGQRQSAVWLDQVFTWFKLPHTYVVQPGGHSETYWTAHLDDYLRFYAAIRRPAPPPSPTSRLEQP